jgi:hypothetical protein
MSPPKIDGRPFHETTKYGFRFGPALVERLAHHKGYVILGVETKRNKVEITVTQSGLIRVTKPIRNLGKAYATSKNR